MSIKWNMKFIKQKKKKKNYEEEKNRHWNALCVFVVVHLVDSKKIVWQRVSRMVYGFELDLLGFQWNHKLSGIQFELLLLSQSFKTMNETVEL